MAKYRFSTEQVLYILLFILLGAVYISHAPHTVQTGDSGELAAAAFGKLVPHPPGFPTWLWLNHLWLKLNLPGSVFFQLSLLNIAIALGALGVLGKSIKSVPAKMLTIASLGFSLIFWKFAELPEVFMLNVFFAGIVIYTGNSKSMIANKIPISATLMPLAFSIGLANHPTLIFLLPYVTWTCWRQRKSIWLYASIAIGVITCASLYSSLLLLKTTHLYSWGNLQNLHDVWNHFLRKDYGTFSLHPKPNQNALPMLLAFFVDHTFLTIFPLGLIGIYVLVEKYIGRKQLVWDNFNWAILASYLFYVCVFVPMMQMAPIYQREEMTERFFILPLFLIMLLLGKFIGDNFEFSDLKRKWIPACVVIATCFWSFTTYSHDNDYSENTILEDYATNFLSIAKEFKNPVIAALQDSQVFSLRYMQVVKRYHREVLITTHLSELNPHNLKVKYYLPTLHQAIVAAGEAPAPASTYTLLSDEELFDPKQFKLTYLPLGFRVEQGQGVSFEKTNYVPQFNSDSSLIQTPLTRYNQYRSILTSYSRYFVYQGLEHLKRNEMGLAVDNFERGLTLTPFNAIPLLEICKIKSSQRASDPKCRLQEQAKSWFNYYPFLDL